MNPFSFARIDKDFRKKGQMDPSLWAIVATVPSSEAAHGCTFVRRCNLGNSPINQLCSGCHRLDIGQSPLLGRPGVGLEGELGGVSISGTGHSTVGTLGLVMGKLLLGKEEADMTSGFNFL